MAANEGVIKAVVNFYQDHSDAVFLGLSYDLRPNLLKVQTEKLELSSKNLDSTPLQNKKN